MGVTSNGLRYPEPTGLANQLHIFIQRLAEDVDSRVLNHDPRGIPISRHAGVAATLTNLPDNDALYNTFVNGSIVTIPSTAVTALLVQQHPARCEGNAQCHWYPQYTLNGGAVWNDFGTAGFYTSHNQNNPAIDMGLMCSIEVDVRANRGQALGLAMTGRNDGGSVAWIHVGFLHWSITFLS